MDIKEKIQLGEFKNVDSINVDNSIKLNLESTVNVKTEYDLNTIVDVTQVFDDERQASTKYRIYGEFEWFSMLNTLNQSYKTKTDIFEYTPLDVAQKTPLNSLRFYLVKPSGATDLGNPPLSTQNRRYQRTFEVLATFDSFDLQNAGFSKNIYDEQQYSFILNKTVDISGMTDGFDLPITQLYLYIEYVPQTNGFGVPEQMENTEYVAGWAANFNRKPFSPTILSVGDTIEGDVVEFDEETLTETIVRNQNYFIYTKVQIPNPTTNISVRWFYNPFIPIRLRYFENEVRTANSGDTSYEVTNSIPDYAKAIDNDGNFRWRNLLDNGFFDPIDEIGVRFPFINGNHYVFNNIILSIDPDLTSLFTQEIFGNIEFPDSTLLNNKPNSDLDNIGKICN